MKVLQKMRGLQLPISLVVLCQVFVSLWALSNQALSALEWGYQVDTPVIKWIFAMFRNIDGWGTIQLFMAVGLGAVYYVVRKNGLQKSPHLTILCLFFAVSTVFGISYSETGTWDYIFHGRLQFGLAVFVILGYYFAYKNCILFVKYVLQQKKEILRKESCCKAEQFLFEKHSFLATFLVILAAGIPWLVFLWPGPLQEDSLVHIWQHYGELPGNAMSPVGVTWLMGKCMDLGKSLFHSDNVGLFLYNGSQFMAQTLIFAYSFCVMKRLRAPMLFRWAALILYAVYPVFPSWGYTLVKDTGYYLCSLLLVLVLADSLSDTWKRPVWWHWALLVVSTIGMSIFRNNGKYIAIATLAIALILYRKYWKLYLVGLLACLAITLLIDKVYIPNNGYVEGPIKESLSIPVQMTARYLTKHMDEVTPEEREALQTVFVAPLEEVVGYYNPEVSDPVKGRFADYPTEEQLSDYFGVWWQQFLKHPDTYAQAFLNHTYGYFYPERKNFWGDVAYFRILGRQAWQDNCVDVSFGIEDQNGRNVLEEYTKLVYRMPVVGMIFSSGLHMYVILGCLVYLIAKKRKRAIAVLVPSLCMILCIMSPVDAMFRYVLPLVAALPINLAWCHYATEKESS